MIATFAGKVNPRQARRFAEATGKLAKTDRLDAAILARMGASTARGSEPFRGSWRRCDLSPAPRERRKAPSIRARSRFWPGAPAIRARRRAAPSASRWASRWSFDTSTPMVSLFIFSAPLLVIRGSPPGIRSGQRKRRGRSNSSSTRQTVSALPIRPSPLREGSHLLSAVPSRLLGMKSHKTSVLLLG